MAAKDANGHFQSPEQAQLQEVRRQLAEVETELAAIAGKVPHCALRAALGNPEPGDEDVLRHQQQLDARLHLLRQAESAALQAEQDRQTAKEYESDAARHRALIQQLSRLHKASLKVSASAANIASAVQEMQAAGRAAFALLPPHMQRNNSGPLSPGYLARIARAEIGRMDSEAPMGSRLFDQAPWSQDLRRGNGFISMPDLIAHHVAGLKDIAAKHTLVDPNAKPDLKPVRDTSASQAEPAGAPQGAAAEIRPDAAPEQNTPATPCRAPPLDVSVNMSSVPMAEKLVPDVAEPAV